MSWRRAVLPTLAAQLAAEAVVTCIVWQWSRVNGAAFAKRWPMLAHNTNECSAEDEWPSSMPVPFFHPYLRFTALVALNADCVLDYVSRITRAFKKR